MARRLVVVLGVVALSLCLAAPGLAKGMDDHGAKGTVTKVEGNQVTVTVESKGKMDLNEGDQVWLKSGKMKKDGDDKMKKEGGGMKSSPPEKE